MKREMFNDFLEAYVKKLTPFIYGLDTPTLQFMIEIVLGKCDENNWDLDATVSELMKMLYPYLFGVDAEYLGDIYVDVLAQFNK